MIIIVIRQRTGRLYEEKESIYLCGMRPEHYDQMRLSIMAARECGFMAMEEVANEIKIAVLWSKNGGTILRMGRDGVTFLMAVMVHIVKEEIRLYNSEIIHEILEALTCAMEMTIATAT